MENGKNIANTIVCNKMDFNATTLGITRNSTIAMAKEYLVGHIRRQYHKACQENTQTIPEFHIFKVEIPQHLAQWAQESAIHAIFADFSYLHCFISTNVRCEEQDLVSMSPGVVLSDYDIRAIAIGMWVKKIRGDPSPSCRANGCPGVSPHPL